jgi:hypothetical protein
VLYVKGCGSASQALKFARGIGLKSKLYLVFVLNCYRVALLRHLVLIVKFVVPRKSSRLTNVAGLLIEYVISCIIYSITWFISEWLLQASSYPSTSVAHALQKSTTSSKQLYASNALGNTLNTTAS